MKSVSFSFTGETASHVTASIKDDGGFQIAIQDIGKASKEIFRDSDYEYWYSIDAAYKDILLLKLFELAFSKDLSFDNNLREFLSKNNIPFDFFSY
jgi:hypothetical protein